MFQDDDHEKIFRISIGAASFFVGDQICSDLVGVLLHDLPQQQSREKPPKFGLMKSISASICTCGLIIAVPTVLYYRAQALYPMLGTIPRTRKYEDIIFNCLIQGFLSGCTIRGCGIALEMANYCIRGILSP